MQPFQTVKQEEGADCAVCVVAMITQISLATIKRNVFKGILGCYNRKECFMFIEQYTALCVSPAQSVSFSDLKQGVRGYVRVETGHMVTHAVYWDGQKLHDPSNAPQIDLSSHVFEVFYVEPK